MKTFIKNTILLLLMLFVSIISFAQNERVHFTKIGLEEGLPQHHIFSMTQDSDGYIWVSTLNGLGKYNGKNFKNYSSVQEDSTTIPSSFVYKYFEDSKKRPYVVTNKGFAEFDKVKGQFTRYYHQENNNSLSSNQTRDLLETAEGRIIIATGVGVDLFNPETKEFTNYLHPKFDSGRFTPSLLYDNKQQIWAGSVNGLYKVDEKKELLKYYPLINNEGRALNIFNLLQDSFGTIWVASNRGLYIFSTDTEKFQLVDFGLEDTTAKPFALLEYPKGKLYIGTDKGLYHWGIKEKKVIDSYVYATDNPEGISVNSVQSLMLDSANNLWIGLFHGINIINPEVENYKLYYNKKGLNNSKNTILEICSDSKGRLWTNTMEGLFLKEYPEAEAQEIYLPPSNKKGYKNIKQIVEATDGNIWIATAKDGLFKSVNQSSEFVKVAENSLFKNYRLKSLVFDVSDKNTLWISTDKGLCNYNIKTGDTVWVYPKKLDTDLINNDVRSLHQHKNGSVWFTNSRKLCVYNPRDNTLKKFKTSKEDTDSWYSGWSYNMVSTDDRIYLSGVSFSYFNIEKETFTNFTETSIVSSILKADDDDIWFIANKNVWKFIPENDKLESFEAGDFGEFMTDSYGKSKEGKLFFGANNGIFEVDPNKTIIAQTPPKVVLSSFSISNKTQNFEVENQFVKTVNLENTDNIFTISYAALQYTKNEKLNYRYQLKGFDKDWVNAQFKTEATYTNLNPGNYVFVVEAVNSAGLFSDKPLILEVIIAPHFWQTKLFYLLVIATAFAILFLLYSNRKRLQKLREEKLVAEQSAIYKSKFLANMSHEFRTPMNAIMGLNKLMISSNLDTKQKEYAKGIDMSCENLLWIINDILDQSKIESGKMTIRKQAFNIKEVVDQISLLLKLKMNEKQLEFNVKIADEIPNFLLGDPTRVFQILTNLVGNAIKFTEKGRIDLNIKLKQKTDDKVVLLLEVVDTGIGIPKSKIDEIFKSFEQVYSTQKDSKYFSEGTGLGLSISKELVEQMGGEIYLESEINVGSKFYFDLTFDIDTTQKSSPKEKIEDLKLPENLKILLVEDTPVNRFLAIELLKQHLVNIKVDVAENGEIALEKIESKQYDLVLMDIKMPVMDGLEATKRIRSKKNDYFKNIPILGLTANAISQQLEEAKNVGMTACITKPIFLPELLSSIEKVTKKN